MQLDKIIITTRTRSPWAAIDLGFKLGLRYFLPCFFLWIILATPFLVLITILFHDKFWVMLIGFWWLKPLFERPLLFLLSRELFNQKVSISNTLKSYKEWLIPGWLMAITFGRISFSRSFYMPLTVLEKLSGKARTSRVTALHSSLGSEAGMLTVVLYCIEGFLVFGAL